MKKIYSNIDIDEFFEEDVEFPVKSVKRQERRKTDFEKAIRKQQIALFLYKGDCYEHLHSYSDNKVHCSCPLCAAKTSKKHVARAIRSSFHKLPKNYKPSEIKKWQRDKFKLAEAVVAE